MLCLRWWEIHTDWVDFFYCFSRLYSLVASTRPSSPAVPSRATETAAFWNPAREQLLFKIALKKNQTFASSTFTSSNVYIYIDIYIDIYIYSLMHLHWVDLKYPIHCQFPGWIFCDLFIVLYFLFCLVFFKGKKKVRSHTGYHSWYSPFWFPLSKGHRYFETNCIYCIVLK